MTFDTLEVEETHKYNDEHAQNTTLPTAHTIIALFPPKSTGSSRLSSLHNCNMCFFGFITEINKVDIV